MNFHSNLPSTCCGISGSSLTFSWVSWILNCSMDVIISYLLHSYKDEIKCFMICKALYTCKWSLSALLVIADFPGVYHQYYHNNVFMEPWDWLAHWNTGKVLIEYLRETEWQSTAEVHEVPKNVSMLMNIMTRTLGPIFSPRLGPSVFLSMPSPVSLILKPIGSFSFPIALAIHTTYVIKSG